MYRADTYSPLKDTSDKKNLDGIVSLEIQVLCRNLCAIVTPFFLIPLLSQSAPYRIITPILFLLV